MTADQINIADAYCFLSNSPEVGVDGKRVWKVIKATETHDIVVLKPVIDKLRLTFSGLGVIQHIKGLQAAAYWDEVYKLAYGVSKDGCYDHISACPVEGYKTGLRVDLGDGSVATFGFDPRIPKNASVRLEFNPLKLTPLGVKTLMRAWKLIEFDNVPLAAHLTSARVTRCDIAIDVLNMRLADLFVFHPDVWKVWICTSMDQGAQTLNFYKLKKNQSPFLDPKKRSNVVVYDKKAEREAFGVTPEFGSLAHTRVEFQLNKTALFKNLINTPCPANDWKFCRTIAPQTPIAPNRWRMFLDSARFRGFAEAERLLEPDEQQHFKEAVGNPNKQLTPFIDNGIWKYWSVACEAPPVAQLLEFASSHPKEHLTVTKFEL